ncbi:MAG: molybdopterin-dependent oxidoreductase [Xanthomonadales bacterium]|jgi:xanthine dehydrogenase molybdenum-binding subunit|nr:molybdopterin-dependent oxidoreductase [Xanthomonadales bacterium]
MSKLNLTVNGKRFELDVPQSRYLARVLREDLGLTGTKVGCNEAECGICTVLVDGTPVNSCVYPAFKAQGARVETIEGLSADGLLHPLQQAFQDHGAVQCGICTPGLIMTSKALLDEKAAAGETVSADDVKAALKDTSCRCTGYQSVIRAVLQASGQESKPYIPETRAPEQEIGKAQPNPDALAKLTGRARFTDDYQFPGMLHARTLRAGIPHGRIRYIDTSAALELPGVQAVLTHEDVPGRKRHGLVVVDWPVLCSGKVRYAGDAVAIVAADSKEIAAEALDLIQVGYEELPAVSSAVDALKPGAPLVHEDWPDGNLLKHIKVAKGDIEEGFSAADVVVDRTYRTPTVEHLFLEPECSIAVPAGYDPAVFDGHHDHRAQRGETAVHDKATVYVGSQIPYADRDQVAAALGVEPEAVRIVATLMGGGFGGKEDIAGQIHAALLAEVTGRPVKMLYSRQESLLFHPKRHATVIRIRTGATRDGKLTAVQSTIYGDGGAYASLSEKVLTRATTHASGPYDVPHVKVDCLAAYTNNAPCGAFRGFGVSQSCFAVESNMDILAGKLGMDPVELRRKNTLDVGSVTCTGQLMRESVGLNECIDRVNADMRSDDFRWTWEEGGSRFAWGLAVGYKNTGLGGGAPDQATAEVGLWLDDEDKPRAEVRISSAELGQGLPAVLAACAAEELGLPRSRVSVLLGDTDYCPDGGPTTASRQTYVSGNAARLAARRLRLRLMAACNQCDGLADSIASAARNGISTTAQYEYHAPQTQPLGTGGDMHFAFGFCAQAVLCEIEMDSGAVHVRKVIAAHDVGRAINPLTLEGQVEGGIVMCIGYALSEHYIQEQGQPWTTVMARYSAPRIEHAPEIVSHIVEHETSEGPYGAKGVGELPSIPTSAAITNAIQRATGVRVRSLPVDQDQLLLAMKAGLDQVELGWGDSSPIPFVTFEGES